MAESESRWDGESWQKAARWTRRRGPSRRHIPTLVVGDSVYFIENACGCAPGSGGGG
jgi:hypothetical protein